MHTGTVTRLASVICLLVVALAACGHDRPSQAERVLVPLIPTRLPSGYVLSRVDERPASGEGRWIDFSFAPASSSPTDASMVVSLHQWLDVDPDLDFFADGGDPVQVRGRPAVCGGDGILRWLEKRSALMTIGGGDLACADLVAVADSMIEVDPSVWRTYERSGRDE
jgi:hypothetical protein